MLPSRFFLPYFLVAASHTPCGTSFCGRSSRLQSDPPLRLRVEIAVTPLPRSTVLVGALFSDTSSMVINPYRTCNCGLVEVRSTSCIFLLRLEFSSIISSTISASVSADAVTQRHVAARLAFIRLRRTISSLFSRRRRLVLGILCHRA